MADTGRITLGSYTDYQHAQRAVDTLADRQFPVHKLAIVAGDLRMVEQVTGRQTWASAAARGALNGALIGALLGFLLGLFSIVDPLVSGLALALYGVLLGGVVGLIIGLAAQAASSGRRDFRSLRTLDAARYDVVCDADVTEDARRVLEEEGIGEAPSVRAAR